MMKPFDPRFFVLAVVLFGLLSVGCEQERRADTVRESHTSSREPTKAAPPAVDPGPQVWRPPNTGGEPIEDAARAGGGGPSSNERRAARLTKAEIQGSLSGLRDIDEELGNCREAFQVLRQTSDAMGELLDESRMGTPDSASYLAVCRALPADVQRCMTLSQHAADPEGCQRVLARFGRDRENPAWLEALSGHPASERPDPATSEEEARALRRHRQRGEEPE